MMQRELEWLFDYKVFAFVDYLEERRLRLSEEREHVLDMFVLALIVRLTNNDFKIVSV